MIERPHNNRRRNESADIQTPTDDIGTEPKKPLNDTGVKHFKGYTEYELKPGVTVREGSNIPDDASPTIPAAPQTTVAGPTESYEQERARHPERMRAKAKDIRRRELDKIDRSTPDAVMSPEDRRAIAPVLRDWNEDERKRKEQKD
jgi:hypothetical protein